MYRFLNPQIFLEKITQGSGHSVADHVMRTICTHLD